jgi:phosphate-selective porin
MFDGILAKLTPSGNTPVNDFAEPRRKQMRRDGMNVDVVIGRRAYTVYDWSPSGVSFETPDHNWNAGGVYFDDVFVPQLREGEQVHVTLRFHLLQGAVDVPVAAHITRSYGGVTGARLITSRAAQRQIKAAIDSLNAQSFLESQLPPTGSSTPW